MTAATEGDLSLGIGATQQAQSVREPERISTILAEGCCGRVELIPQPMWSSDPQTNTEGWDQESPQARASRYQQIVDGQICTEIGRGRGSGWG